MKSVRILVLLILTLGFVTMTATSAHALGIFAQWQDAKDMDGAFGLGLKHDFTIIPLVGIDARVSYHLYTEGDGMNMFPLEAFGKLNLGLFYGGLGIGYYIFSGNDFAPDNEIGGFVAGGVSFGLGGLGAFAELRYLLLEPSVGNAKLDLSGFGVNAGVTLPI